MSFEIAATTHSLEKIADRARGLAARAVVDAVRANPQMPASLAVDALSGAHDIYAAGAVIFAQPHAVRELTVTINYFDPADLGEQLKRTRGLHGAIMACLDLINLHLRETGENVLEPFAGAELVTYRQLVEATIGSIGRSA